MKYLVATAKSWNQRVYTDTISHYPGTWSYIAKKEDLNPDKIKSFEPRYIFFLHWSWKVPEEIINSYECVCFHMTDVPYGRGGSPLQNLITRGFRETKLTALRMEEDFDAGPVYLKEPLSLEGSAEEIYIRTSRLAAKMIQKIIKEELVPVPQEGEPTLFKRRKPIESEIRNPSDLKALHDFIRMLDAEGYPKAFINHAGYRYTLSRAAFYEGRIVADVTITHDKEEG